MLSSDRRSLSAGRPFRQWHYISFPLPTRHNNTFSDQTFAVDHISSASRLSNTFHRSLSLLQYDIMFPRTSLPLRSVTRLIRTEPVRNSTTATFLRGFSSTAHRNKGVETVFTPKGVNRQFHCPWVLTGPLHISTTHEVLTIRLISSHRAVLSSRQGQRLRLRVGPDTRRNQRDYHPGHNPGEDAQDVSKRQGRSGSRRI